MADPNQHAAPPSGFAQRLKNPNVNEGEHQSRCHVCTEAVKFSAISVGREDGTEHVRKVHARQSKPLGGGADGGEHNRRQKSPEQPACPVHARAPGSAALVSAPVCTAGCGSPRSFSSRVSAALISPR